MNSYLKLYFEAIIGENLSNFINFMNIRISIFVLSVSLFMKPIRYYIELSLLRSISYDLLIEIKDINSDELSINLLIIIDIALSLILISLFIVIIYFIFALELDEININQIIHIISLVFSVQFIGTLLFGFFLFVTDNQLISTSISNIVTFWSLILLIKSFRKINNYSLLIILIRLIIGFMLSILIFWLAIRGIEYNLN